MKPDKTFQMTYSAREQEELRRIRAKYAPPAPDKMARLRALDAGAEKKATAVSVTVGVIGTLLLGLGMSLAMSSFGAPLGHAAVPAGIVIGLLGIAVLGGAYPVYLRRLKQERAKIAPEILKLTDELMQG